MIRSLDWLVGAGASGVRVFREKKHSWEICGHHHRDVCADELAFPLTERGSWLGVHREAGLGLLGSVEIMCATVPRV